MRRSLLVLVAVLVAGLLAAPGASAGAATARPNSRVVHDCQHASYEPRTVVIACADANTILRKIKYSRWSNHAAAGTGVMYANSCDPNCAAGKLIKTVTRFKLERPKRVDGQPRFSRLIAVYPGVHGEDRREVFELATSRL